MFKSPPPVIWSDYSLAVRSLLVTWFKRRPPQFENDWLKLSVEFSCVCFNCVCFPCIFNMFLLQTGDYYKVIASVNLCLLLCKWWCSFLPGLNLNSCALSRMGNFSSSAPGLSSSACGQFVQVSVTIRKLTMVLMR